MSISVSMAPALALLSVEFTQLAQVLAAQPYDYDGLAQTWLNQLQQRLQQFGAQPVHQQGAVLFVTVGNGPGQAQAETLADRLDAAFSLAQSLVEQPLEVAGQPMAVKLGLAMAPPPPEAVDPLLAAQERAMAPLNTLVVGADVAEALGLRRYGLQPLDAALTGGQSGFYCRTFVSSPVSASVAPPAMSTPTLASATFTPVSGSPTPQGEASANGLSSKEPANSLFGATTQPLSPHPAVFLPEAPAIQASALSGSTSFSTAPPSPPPEVDEEAHPLELFLTQTAEDHMLATGGQEAHSPTAPFYGDGFDDGLEAPGFSTDTSSVGPVPAAMANTPTEVPLETTPVLPLQKEAANPPASTVLPEPLPPSQPWIEQAPWLKSYLAQLPPIPQWQGHLTYWYPDTQRQNPTHTYQQTVEALYQALTPLLNTHPEAPTHTQRPLLLNLAAHAGLGKTTILQMVKNQLMPTETPAEAPTEALDSLKAAPAEPPLIWLQAVANGNANTYAPLQLWSDLLRNWLDLPVEGGAFDVAAHRLQQSWHLLEADAPEAQPNQTSGFWAAKATLETLLLLQPGSTGAAPTSEETPPMPLSEALYYWLGALTRQKPLVLVLDDVDAADPTSVAVLMDLLENNPATTHPLTVILTQQRLSQPSPVLAQRLQALSTHWHYQSWVIADLNQDELLNFLNDGPLSGQIQQYPLGLLRQLGQVSQGLPLRLEEWIRYLTLIGALHFSETHQGLVPADPMALEALETLPLPQTLAEILNHRLQALDETSRYILEQVALLGERTSTDLLMDLVQLPPEAFSQALQTLWEHGWIMPDAGQGVAFRHQALYEGIYQGLSAEARHLGHGKVYQRLKELMEAGYRVHPSRLATQALLSGQLPAAASYAVANMAWALQAGAPQAAWLVAWEVLSGPLAQALTQRQSLSLWAFLAHTQPLFLPQPGLVCQVQAACLGYYLGQLSKHPCSTETLHALMNLAEAFEQLQQPEEAGLAGQTALSLLTQLHKALPSFEAQTFSLQQAQRLARLGQVQAAEACLSEAGLKEGFLGDPLLTEAALLSGLQTWVAAQALAAQLALSQQQWALWQQTLHQASLVLEETLPRLNLPENQSEQANRLRLSLQVVSLQGLRQLGQFSQARQLGQTLLSQAHALHASQTGQGLEVTVLLELLALHKDLHELEAAQWLLPTAVEWLRPLQAANLPQALWLVEALRLQTLALHLLEGHHEAASALLGQSPLQWPITTLQQAQKAVLYAQLLALPNPADSPEKQAEKRTEALRWADAAWQWSSAPSTACVELATQAIETLAELKLQQAHAMEAGKLLEAQWKKLLALNSPVLLAHVAVPIARLYQQLAQSAQSAQARVQYQAKAQHFAQQAIQSWQKLEAPWQAQRIEALLASAI